MRRCSGAWLRSPGPALGIAVCLVAAFFSVTGPGRAETTAPTVVVLLFDGLAPSMVSRASTPSLARLRREGAWSHGLVPAFPTVSLVNGFTLSTGCWPERHGIVGNRFWDPERGLYDHSRDADWLTGCQLLHEVAEEQGIPTAVLGWYGAVSATRGALARIARPAESWDDYPGDVERARDVVELLELPSDERPRLVLAYFLGPDDAAHYTGLGSPQTRQAVADADAAVATVLDALERLAKTRPAETFHLFVTTDHGMRPVTRLVNVERLLRDHGLQARVMATGTTAFVYLNDPSRVEEALESLSPYPQFDVIRPDDPPVWSHLGKGPRLGDLILSAHPPYFIEDSGQWPWWARWLTVVGPRFPDASFYFKASHGYPPDTPGISGVLYAWGPGIVRGLELERIEAVDLHPTLAHVLGIEPGRPTDGHVLTALFE